MTLPPKMKQGTPSMPASLALLASPSMRSTSASLANNRRTKSPSMPQSTAAWIGAFGKVELHEALLHARGIGGAARPKNETMAVERVGLPGHLVGRVDQPFHGGGGADPFGDRGVAFDGAEFGFQISLPVNPFARNPGIEEI